MVFISFISRNTTWRNKLKCVLFPRKHSKVRRLDYVRLGNVCPWRPTYVIVICQQIGGVADSHISVRWTMSGRSSGRIKSPVGCRCHYILKRCVAIHLRKQSLVRHVPQQPEASPYWMYDNGYLIFQASMHQKKKKKGNNWFRSRICNCFFFFCYWFTTWYFEWRCA